MKLPLAYEGGNPWAWKPHIDRACRKKKIQLVDLFGRAAAWAPKNSFKVDDPPQGHTHLSLYLDSIQKGRPPRVPPFVRGYVTLVLRLNDVRDIAVTVHRLVPADSAATRRSARRREPFRRPSRAIAA